MVTLEQKFLLLQILSGNFYCERIPDEWTDMSDDQKTVWMEENTCEVYENETLKLVYKMLEITTDEVVKAVNNGLFN